MRVDLVGRNIQRIETVADEGQIVQPLDRFTVRPDALREAGAEEVVGHAPIRSRKEWEGVVQRSAAWNSGVPSRDREGLAELPADVACDNDRRGPGGGP